MIRQVSLLIVLLACSALLGQEGKPPAATASLEWIRPSGDGTHFVRTTSGKPFVVWGVNYDHDHAGRLLEDYWHTEWNTVAEDFAEIKDLGANVVRIHLQVSRFMTSATETNAENLAQLRKLVTLAEDTGLYLDVTGLGCYHKEDVPAWYDELEEQARWEVQARFWKAIAEACKESPAIFCYDLMNEPVLTGGKNPQDWLVGEPLGGKYFVQRITTSANGRDNREIARNWVAKLTSAIRSVDEQHMITVGVIPWAQVFKGAKPLFYSPEVSGPLDFVSIHLYPKSGKLDDDLAAMHVYDIGKPLVIEEIFPLGASAEETLTFINKSKSLADGWVSFYWGRTIEEYEADGDLKAALVAGWLKCFREHARAATTR